MWEIAGRVLPQFYVFVVSAAIARHLGPSIFGRIALISGVEIAVTTVVTWGMPLALSRSVGEIMGAGRTEQLRGLMAWAYRVMLVGAVASFALMAGAAAAGAKPSAVWILVGLTAAGAVLHAVPSSFLIGAQRWREARIMGIATGTVSAAAKVAALAAGQGIVTLFAIDLVIVIANLGGTALIARYFQRDLLQGAIPPEVKRGVLTFAGIVGISTVVNLVVYQRTEIFVLARDRSDAEIARYAVPYSMITTLLLLPAAAGAVLSPAVATLWGARDMDRIRSGVARSVRLMLLLTITLAGIASAVGPAFVRIVFGSAFADVRTIMIVLAVGLPLVPLGTVSGSVLRAIGTLRWLTIWGITGGIANVVLAFVLVAPFGAIGAAAANSSAQMAVAVPLLVCMRRQIGSVDLKVAGLVRLVLLVTFATAASIVVGDQLPLAAQIVVGSGLFLAVVLAGSGPLRVLSRDDAGWLAELLAGRARGVPASIARYASGQRGG